MQKVKNMDFNIEDFKIDFNNNEEIKMGRILLSEPFSGGIFFKRSVVFLTEYKKNGALGFILNKKTNLKINNILKNFPKIDADVYLGGPVRADTIHYLHSVGKQIPGSLKIKENIYWGGDFNYLKLLIEVGSISEREIKFFVGYSGWTKNQLENEVKNNVWAISNISSEEVFKYQDTKKMWTNFVGSLGSKYKLWTQFPENPNFN